MVSYMPGLPWLPSDSEESEQPGKHGEGKKGVLSQNNIPCIPTNPHCGVDGLL